MWTFSINVLKLNNKKKKEKNIWARWSAQSVKATTNNDKNQRPFHFQDRFVYGSTSAHVGQLTALNAKGLPQKAFTICITNYRSNACSRSWQASPSTHTLPIYGCWKQAETSLPTRTTQLRTSLVHEAKNDRHPFQHDSHRLMSVKLYMTGQEPVRVPFSTLAYSSSFTQCLHKSKRMS